MSALPYDAGAPVAPEQLGPAHVELSISARTLARRLPPDFVLGAATAAYQVEGATREDGRTESVWDAWLADGGRTVDGSDARRAVEHYRMMPQDVGLMRGLGLDAYRFSVAWPRIIPEPGGTVNRKGLDFYDRLLDELGAAGIEAMATLFHWDTPQYLQEAGGWMERDTAYRFADYAEQVGRVLGDRVRWWCTVNEPATVAGNGYAADVHAPAGNHGVAALRSVHHLLLGHGLAARALRAVGVAGGIGLSNVHSPVEPRDPGSILDRTAADLVDTTYNRIFADPVLLGDYPTAVHAVAGVAGLKIEDGDLAVVSAPLDFYGLNYYMPTLVAAGPGRDGPLPASMVLPTGGSVDGSAPSPLHVVEWPHAAKTAYGWPVVPGHLGVMLGRMRERYPQLPPVYITEGGASFEEVPLDGQVQDANRAAYLYEHLLAALDAVGPGGPAEGLELRGYFIWTLMDNWEWAAGYRQKFGLVHVDRDTFARTPKASYHWLRKVLQHRLEYAAAGTGAAAGA
ncbi:glycoside hydrolase family 1 protein [Zafaria sp. J156]|uniref:glycoside hydrolase family 1 protein n=1 Tax=Zafaria sp. J156 TaxID=3116490 RepID=UPI002E7812A0|nr:family 1 glycosylhydrolase [Zafaria sp. J156]MEE1620987.1 family 1 glycosylhydrolase [Zafaria sp. J156]